MNSTKAAPRSLAEGALAWPNVKALLRIAERIGSAANGMASGGSLTEGGNSPAAQAASGRSASRLNGFSMVRV
jgi:hypothetical protein